ncbi:peptidoglycan DD-metalloendopeptidase family protein [Evansella sp. AB-P1]|uniref:peptidoglycan DD-metalloendopeptidase family protein n=1 Tax=Evansella sp. AB-P1 TaxID=3037653 RepID=UPI00241F5F96|nr:peptidoglycan DD-metalloendopeptidase family protein [Evansella sp. AB-P1]MDG5789480.1 peptidoglycan DD-metalloendopeptidase family protein [Evansella sp. AB-P1]
MKGTILILLTCIFLMGCTLLSNEQAEPNNMNEYNERSAKNHIEKNKKEHQERELEEIIHDITLTTTEINNHTVVSVEALMEEVEGTYEFDEINRTLKMNVLGREFYLVYEVPVLEVDGEYLSEEVYLEIDQETLTPYVTISFLEVGFETEMNVDNETETLAFLWEDEVIQAWSSRGEESFDLHSMSVEEMINYLSFLERPIENAQVSTVISHLPGAPRPYRNGTHEGIDWYEYGTGAVITTDTPIRAMGEGVVVRVDHDFEEYESAQIRNEDLRLSAEIGFTPEYILDRLRGKQVWVQYQNGVMNRFAHLHRIPDELTLGQTVDANTVIGYVGNTGTSYSVDNQSGLGLHLHQDLLIYGELFWEPYSPEEVQRILRSIWN